MLPCYVIVFILTVQEFCDAKLARDLSYRQVIASSPQCKKCTGNWKTPPAFCNIVAPPLPNYKTYISKVYEENDYDDPCYCEKVGSIFYAKDAKLPACTRVPNICKTLSKDEVCNKAGWTCSSKQWSTFHCTCGRGWQGQLCNIPSSAGEVVKNPILVHYLYAPLFQQHKSSEYLVPGLYFITERLGDDFRLVVNFDDGRKIQVRPSSFTRKNYRKECLTDVKEKIHFTSEHLCNLIPAGNVFGYGIFLDKMLRVDLSSSDNLIPVNKTYGLRSAGRFSELSIQVKNKERVTWEWDTFKVFVPYQRHFLACSKKLEIDGCENEKLSPALKSVHQPIVFRASFEMWPTSVMKSVCLTSDVIVVDHRWYIRDIELVDNVVPSPMLPLKYSQGVDGNVKFVSESELGEGKYMITYDFIQEYTFFDPRLIDTQYVTRKLCYFDIVGNANMQVYFHTRSKGVICKKPFNIDVMNYNARTYDNERLTITWTCEGSSTAECGVKQTKGLQPYTNELKCGVDYKFTAMVTHPKSAKTQIYQIEISSENRNSVLEVQCIEGCGYKVNVDQFLYLKAMVRPPISTSWKWDIVEVTRSLSGNETFGKDLVGSVRQPDTDPDIFILPPNRLTMGKEYRVTAINNALVPTYSSYSFMMNKPPEGGKCSVEPTSGVPLETEFLFKCNKWEDDDLPLSYRIHEIPDPSKTEVEPLARSDTSIFDKVKLRRTNIMITVHDSLGSHAQHNLTVTLEKRSKTIDGKYLKTEISDINKKLDGEAQLLALEAIDELTKIVDYQNYTVSEDVSLDLLNTLARIDTFDETLDIHKGLNVLNRIFELRTPVPKKCCDKLLLKSSTILKKYAEVIQDLSNNEKLKSFLDKERLSSSILEASCNVFLERDSVIEEDIVPEDIHEEHKQRVAKATNNVLQSLEILSRVLTQSIKYQQQKHVMQKNCLELAMKHSKRSQTRKELISIDLPEEHYENDSAKIGVITHTEDTLWGIPNEKGLLGIVAQFSNITSDTKGPVDIFMTVPNYHNRSRTVVGEYKPVQACPTESRLDKSFRVHHLRLPDGEGVVILNFTSAMVGKRKLFARQGFRPRHANASSSPIVNSTLAYITFSNRNHATDSDFYIAMIATSEETSKVEYTFTYRILRCAVYVSDQFVSRGCTFKNLTFPHPMKDPIVHCRCNLSSNSAKSTTWFSVNIVVPPQTIILSNDIFLFSTVLNNFSAALPVAIVLIALILLLQWGHRLDCIDDTSRNVILMEENFPGDGHAYVIAVFTGQGIGSGTTSRVAIRVFGQKRYSRVHMLNHSAVRTLSSGRDDWFLMTTATRLGRITRVQMWHDHTGESPEWYCKKVSVFDLNDHVKYDFIIERWFTFDVRVSLDDARMYEGNAATEAEVSRKWYLLVGGWVYSEMREKHHLASIFRRHPRSLYTRCQRTIISVTFIMTTMLVSMMFFNVEEVGPADWPVIPFKLQDVWTGIKSSVISSLITLAVVICFSKQKKYESSSYEEGPNFEVIDDPNESELQTSEVTEQPKSRLAKYQAIISKIIKPSHIEFKPVVLGEIQRKPKKLSLVFLYSGWIVALITITVTSFFVVLYGLKFGPKKSLVWILTFLTGAFSNGIIFGPLKMFLLGLLVSLTFKKSYLDCFTMQIQPDSLKKPNQINYMNWLKMNLRMRLSKHYKPCQTVELEYLRSEKLKERELSYLMTHSGMLVSIFALAIFLTNLFGVRESYYHLRQLTVLFTEGNSDNEAHRVWNNKSAYKFFSKTAIPALHRLRWYNNRTLQVESEIPDMYMNYKRNEKKADPSSPRYRSQVKGFMKDYTHKLVGVPRLRQLRLSNSTFNYRKVHKLFQRIQPSALGNYYWYGEDTQNYFPSWKPYNGYHGFLEQLWVYYSPDYTETGTTTGYSLIRYGGGGHVMPLSWNLGYSIRRLKYLEMSDWLTNRTRCIFLEINVYNNNMKHFSVMRFIIEVLPSGVYWNQPQMDVVTLYLSGRPKAQAVLVLATILLVMLVIYVILCIWHSSRDGLIAYLSTWRGFTDIVLISLGLLSVSSQYNRALHFSLITEYLDRQTRDRYTSLFSPLMTKERSNEIFSVFCIILVFNMGCTLFKFRMYSGMNRVLSKVYKLGITAGILINLYGIVIGIHSVTLDTKLGKLFILQYTFKDEMFHKFTRERRILYVVIAPIVYALFKTYLGYLVYAQDIDSQAVMPPKTFLSNRFKPKRPGSLSKERSEKLRSLYMSNGTPGSLSKERSEKLRSLYMSNGTPRSQIKRKVTKLSDSFEFIE